MFLKISTEMGWIISEIFDKVENNLIYAETERGGISSEIFDKVKN